jgi:citrate lyase beta subunit
VTTIGIRSLPLTPGVPGLSEEDLAAIDRRLAVDDAARERDYPGTGTGRQPVHTVYIPADQFHVEVAEEWGAAAASALARYAPRPEDMARVIGMPADAVRAVWPAVRDKLRTEPVEDLRVDLEDGYGIRSDEEEDRHAAMVGLELAAAVSTGSAPPFLGIRCKSLEPATRRRGLRTLDLVLRTMLDGAELPAGWVITLPKVTSVAQVTAMVDICGRLESAYELAEGALRFEIQVETPQAVLSADGTAGVAAMLHAAAGRCAGLHFGTYDYTASLEIAGGHQSLDHPAADHAKSVMQLAAAGTGVPLSDGSINRIPIGDREDVHAAWELHARLVRRSLERGFYQGWDLHPAQLPTRYLATYLFFRTDLDQVGARLRGYLHRSGGGVLDEPATARALAGFLLRGVHCGAIGAGEIPILTGADLPTLTTLARASSGPGTDRGGRD